MKYVALILLFSLLAISCTTFADSASPNSTYDWTGVYVGGFVGGASSAKTNTTDPYRPSNGNWWSSPYTAPYNYTTSASFIGGGTVGYNWQIGKTAYLIGLEGEYGYLSMDGSGIDPNNAAWNLANPSPSPVSATHNTKIGGNYGYGLVGGRIGYAFDKTLFYIKSGAVFTKTQTNYSDGSFLNTSGSSNTPGYAIGAGIEYALPSQWFKLAKNITIKTEYLYFGINRTQTSSGNNSNGNLYTTTYSISGISTAKIGVNYKF